MVEEDLDTVRERDSLRGVRSARLRVGLEPVRADLWAPVAETDFFAFNLAISLDRRSTSLLHEIAVKYCGCEGVSQAGKPIGDARQNLVHTVRTKSHVGHTKFGFCVEIIGRCDRN
jgi:hypothetical protein